MVWYSVAWHSSRKPRLIHMANNQDMVLPSLSSSFGTTRREFSSQPKCVLSNLLGDGETDVFHQSRRDISGCCIGHVPPSRRLPERGGRSNVALGIVRTIL
ncbi:hypothetical protein EYF80_052376 [Liparis tanakae]|uniref:Uncharacterized protein n=1 Tax=Liparis tanakae TaxID=230148 RepID=A0A4Z2F982_9TELE|nr:hypothetical protein EYF80_052376 [Liparis tanakae]